MTPEEITSRVEAARAFRVQLGGATFDVCLPSDLDIRIASAHALVGTDGTVDVPRAQHEMVCCAVTGWSGDVSIALPDAPPLAVDYDPALVRLVLSHWIEAEDAIADAIHQRRRALEDARKNSASASPTN